eukprot:8809652-Pyramimonas_sp.AAC.1
MIQSRALEYFEAKYQQLAQQRRHALHARMLAQQNLTDDLENALALRRCSGACKKLRRRLRDRRDEQHFHEFKQAVEAEVWRACRRLAC